MVQPIETLDNTPEVEIDHKLIELQQRCHNLQTEMAVLLEIAYKCPLTSLGNRRSFDERFYEEWVRSSVHQSPIALLIIDVDRFKEINDLQGHLAGDDLLRDLAGLWSRLKLRSTDTLTRLGGDEFAIILPDTTAAGAARLADRVIELARSIGVSVSVGIAAAIGEGIDFGPLLKAADEAMYRAKAQGGDRYIA